MSEQTEICHVCRMAMIDGQAADHLHTPEAWAAAAAERIHAAVAPELRRLLNTIFRSRIA